jgi:hypothetical protein
MQLSKFADGSDARVARPDVLDLSAAQSPTARGRLLRQRYDDDLMSARQSLYQGKQSRYDPILTRTVDSARHYESDTHYRTRS